MTEETKILLDAIQDLKNNEIRRLFEKNDDIMKKMNDVEKDIMNLKLSQDKVDKLYRYVSSKKFQKIIDKVSQSDTMEWIDELLKKKVGVNPEMGYTEVLERVLNEEAEKIRTKIEVKKNIIQTISQFFTKKVLAVSILVVLFLLFALSGVIMLFSVITKFPFVGDIIKNLIN